MRIEEIKNILSFIERRFPVPDFGVTVEGFFPYETAKICGNVRVPRSFHRDFERHLRKNHILDNKFVVICSPINNFGEERFAIQFKDNWVSTGKWDDVIPYCEKEFKLKSKFNDSK